VYGSYEIRARFDGARSTNPDDKSIDLQISIWLARAAVEFKFWAKVCLRNHEHHDQLGGRGRMELDFRGFGFNLRMVSNVDGPRGWVCLVSGLVSL
jgi:hypothetical protein